MIEMCGGHSANVKLRKNGTMALRWCAAGMAEATKQFRRVNGFMHLHDHPRTSDSASGANQVHPGS
jgi:hypothetical protein